MFTGPSFITERDMLRKLSCVKSELSDTQISVVVSQLFGYRIKQHEQQKTKNKREEVVPQGAVPPYLLDREGQSRAKVLSNMIKQKRKEKAVRGMSTTSFLPPLPPSLSPSLPPTLPSFLYPSISPSLFPPSLSLSLPGQMDCSLT